MSVHIKGDIITRVVLDIHYKLGKLLNFPFEIILAEGRSNDHTKEVTIDG